VSEDADFVTIAEAALRSSRKRLIEMKDTPRPKPNPNAPKPDTNHSVILLKCRYELPDMLIPRQTCFILGLDSEGKPAADLYIGHPATGEPVLVGMKRVVAEDPYSAQVDEAFEQ
jgi:hypothetical protein